MEVREDEHIIVDFDEALQKTGAELFKELYRIYPVAEVEDYFKNGSWKNDLMKADLRLMEAHRREAGAPDVPDLEDIQFPKDLPKPPKSIVDLKKSIVDLKPLALPKATPKAGATSATGPGALATLDIRLMTLFVAKYKLDPAKARDIFAKMKAEQRRYIISNFKPSAAATAGDGTTALAEIQEFICKTQKEQGWDISCIATNVTGTATADASAQNASSSSTAPATALGVLAKATLPKGGPTPTPGTFVSPLFNVPKLRPTLSSVKTTGFTPAAMVQSMKRPLIPAAGGGMNGLNWNTNKRPALATAVRPSSSSLSLPGKGTRPLTPAAQPPGRLFSNFLNGL